MITIQSFPTKRVNSREENYEKGDMNLKLIPELSIIKKTENLIFLYSPLKAKIHILSKEEYDKIKNGKLNEKEREYLFESGILIPENSSPYPPKINIYSVGLKIFLTSRCNMRCKYCERNIVRVGIDNSFEKIKKFTDFVKKRWGQTAIQEISYFGSGEPTLAFQLLQKIHEYFKSISKKEISFTLVTNGTFSKEIADWIIKNGIVTQVSCDGPPYIQDVQRPFVGDKKSSIAVEKTLRYFVKKGYNKLGTNSVITSYSLDKMEEIFNYLFRIGINAIGFGYAAIAEHINKDLEPNIMRFAEKNLKILELAEIYHVKLRSPLLRIRPSRRFCGAGTMLTIHENGKIGTCNRAGILFPASRFFIIGTINKNGVKIDEKKRESIAKRDVEEFKNCKKCNFKWNCGGLCPFELLSDYGSTEPQGEVCRAMKYFFRNLLKYRVEKEFRKIKPALEIINGNMYYSMHFNKFRLNVTANENEIKPNSFIKIRRGVNFDVLFKNILKARDSNGYKTCVFLLSFILDEKSLNSNYGRKIVKFLKKLKEEKVFFVVTRPLCRKLFGNKYAKILEKFEIPKNWFESVELFKLKGKYAVWKKGNKTEITEETTREELYKKIIDRVEKFPPFDSCKLCIYRLRGNCLI